MSDVICECGHSVKNHDDAGCNHERFIIHNTVPDCSCQLSNSDVRRIAITKLQNELAALRSLLGDAMKALDETHEELVKFRQVCTDNDLITPLWVNERIDALSPMAARIKATRTGGE